MVQYDGSPLSHLKAGYLNGEGGVKRKTRRGFVLP